MTKAKNQRYQSLKTNVLNNKQIFISLNKYYSTLIKSAILYHQQSPFGLKYDPRKELLATKMADTNLQIKAYGFRSQKSY